MLLPGSSAMLRTLIAGALAALLVFPSATASAQSGPGTTDVLVGRTRGAWDLPTRDMPGRVRGLLVDPDGHRFALAARLVPLPMPGDLRGGQMEGQLHLVQDDGSVGRPVAEVHGVYLVRPDRRGRFEAVIAPLSDSDERIGRIEGFFADPQRDDRNPVGHYRGRWVLRR